MSTVLISGQTVHLDPWNRWALQYRWRVNGSGYVHTTLNGRDVLLHRLITGAPDDVTVDHIDHNPLNNVEANLRMATQRQQHQNRSARQNYGGKPKHSIYKGITFQVGAKRKRPWIAQLKTPEGVFLRQYFATEEEAAEQYDAWAVEHFGEWACTNKSLGLL